MKQIRETGLVHEIRDFIERDGVYVGTSAGSIIMGPDIDENLTSPGNDCGLEDLDGFGYFIFMLFLIGIRKMVIYSLV